jgi:protein-L-isoaspartate(D-aspartate) O-methyltransferase
MTNAAEVAKFNMIQQQIRPWEVLDNQVLSVISEIDRQDFVPDSYKGLAYADCQIPVCAGTTMFPPTVEGRMLQALLIEAEDKILEIGSGSGYITACLASLGEQVLSLDTSHEALNLARQNIASYDFANVEFEEASAFNCKYDQAFDVIAVGGTVRKVPENLKQALSIGGRMFIIVGQAPVMQALLITRAGSNEWSTQSLFETDLPALTD